MPEDADSSRKGRKALRTLAVVPVYDHASTLRGIVEGLLGLGLPVLVVDDGSRDHPLARIADLPARGLRLESNRGKGAALLAAASFASAEGFEAILTIDADGQHYPSEAPALLEAALAQWPSIVIGTRNLEGPEVPGSSRFGRSFSNFWVRLECGRTLRDSQSGYRVYPVALLAGTRYLTRRYTFEVEVLVRGAWAGLPILECPIRVLYLPGKARVSHFHAFRDNLRLTCLHTFLVARSLLARPRKARSPQGPGLLLHPGRLLKQLATEHASPLELATAAWMGVFIGSLPIIPFGLAAIVYVNHRLHLNKLAGVAASNVCVAPFVPFLCIQVGHFLRYGAFWTALNRHTLLAEAPQRAWEWLLGAMVVGPLAGLAVAVPVYVLVKRFR